VSERQSDRPSGHGERAAGGASDHPVPERAASPPAGSRPASAPSDRPPGEPADPRQTRIQRLRELIRDADYDVPSDEVAASIIRDALFGAPDADEPR
jgi:hypothetical protein